MIEVKGPRFQRIYVMFILALYFLLSLFFIYETMINFGRLSFEKVFPFLFIMVFVGFVLGFIYRFLANSITRVDIEGDHYRLRRLDKKEIVITADQVKKILHSDRRYVMVLDNQQWYSFPKTPNIKTVLDYSFFDPWSPLMTKERFPNAEFGTLPLF